MPATTSALVSLSTVRPSDAIQRDLVGIVQVRKTAGQTAENPLSNSAVQSVHNAPDTP